ncbi:MAG: adenosylcobinamide-GDP ribazoletransferase [Acidobacteriota bacterium]
MLRSAIVAAQFLTRVPLSRRAGETRELARAVAYFPLVGAIVGAGVAGAAMVAKPLLGLDVAIVAALIFGALLTGAFHEDALADTCDGLGGGFTRERALEIMRDSRVGTYGAIALVLLYAARFTMFRTLGLRDLLLALPLAAALGGASGVALMAWLPNARNEGFAEDVARSLSGGTIAIAIATPLILGAILCSVAALLFITAATIVTAVAGLHFRKRLGGVTGDCIGATNVAVEVTVLACAVGWTRFAPLEVLRWP